MWTWFWTKAEVAVVNCESLQRMNGSDLKLEEDGKGRDVGSRWNKTQRAQEKSSGSYFQLMLSSPLALL